MHFFRDIDSLVWPLVWLSGSMAIGVVLELFFRARIKRILVKNNWLSGGRILKAFRGITFIIFFGVGIYLFVNTISLETTLASYLNKFLYVALILSVTILISRVTVAYLNSYMDRERNEFQGTSIITNITRVATFCVGFVIILQTLNISVTPILTALGVGGLAVALALQDTLSNLFAGIFLIASKKVRIGDFVKLQSGEEGFIEDINWRTITIKEGSDTTVVVPNSKLSTAIYRNYDLPSKEIIFSVSVRVSYKNDMKLVEQLSFETATNIIEQIPNCVKTHIPLIRYNSFDDLGLQLLVSFRVKEVIDQGLVKHEFIKELITVFQERGIKFLGQ
ncbi:MAG TPA: mechanosensitive ion channel domain-containing protein [Cytophagaceae bacterium]|jgi:small-conductance mechanosensitive channel|nr:mechanosensitive ion channel domain-containing protein [Cytophagaceae bacterium]